MAVRLDTMLRTVADAEVVAREMNPLMPAAGSNAAGEALNPATMHWTFIVVSTFVLAITGFWVTRRVVAPRLERMDWETPADILPRQFQVSDEGRRGLRGAFGPAGGVACDGSSAGRGLPART